MSPEIQSSVLCNNQATQFIDHRTPSQSRVATTMQKQDERIATTTDIRNPTPSSPTDRNTPSTTSTIQFTSTSPQCKRVPVPNLDLDAILEIVPPAAGRVRFPTFIPKKQNNLHTYTHKLVVHFIIYHQIWNIICPLSTHSPLFQPVPLVIRVLFRLLDGTEEVGNFSPLYSLRRMGGCRHHLLEHSGPGVHLPLSLLPLIAKN